MKSYPFLVGPNNKVFRKNVVERLKLWSGVVW